jgi:DNA primase (bacterial type)
MTKIDFDKIRRDNPLPDVIRKSGVDLVEDGNEFRACCCFHGEKTPSFTVFNSPKSGWSYFCFGCGVHGDVTDFVKERYGYASTTDAVKFLTGEDSNKRPLTTTEYKEATNSYDGYDIVKPPEGVAEIVSGVRTPPILNPKRVNPETGMEDKKSPRREIRSIQIYTKMNRGLFEVRWNGECYGFSKDGEFSSLPGALTADIHEKIKCNYIHHAIFFKKTARGWVPNQVGNVSLVFSDEDEAFHEAIRDGEPDIPTFLVVAAFILVILTITYLAGISE